MRNLKRRVLAALTLTGSIVAVAAVLAPTAFGDTTPPVSAFAISDANAVPGAHVTFWGSQWWKDNQLSTDNAPAAFKGYVSSVDSTSCTFTTTTGDSAPLPDGPLPPVITVVVTGSVSQSGSTVTGTISRFAVIATDDGYDTNPGHVGTGTVIDYFSCGDGGGPL